MYVKEESRQNAQLISFPLSLSPFFLTSAHVQNGERERESMCTRVYRPDRVPSGKINVQGLCSGVVAFIRIQAGQACQYPYSVVRIGRIVLTTLRCRQTLSIGFCAHLSRSMYMDREERRRDNWFSIRRTKTRNAKLFLYESVIWGGRNQEYICDIKRLKGGTFSKILISYWSVVVDNFFFKIMQKIKYWKNWKNSRVPLPRPLVWQKIRLARERSIKGWNRVGPVSSAYGSRYYKVARVNVTRVSKGIGRRATPKTRRNGRYVCTKWWSNRGCTYAGIEGEKETKGRVERRWRRRRMLVAAYRRGRV